MVFINILSVKKWSMSGSRVGVEWELCCTSVINFTSVNDDAKIRTIFELTK